MRGRSNGSIVASSSPSPRRCQTPRTTSKCSPFEKGGQGDLPLTPKHKRHIPLLRPEPPCGKMSECPRAPISVSITPMRWTCWPECWRRNCARRRRDRRC
ncbi:hypothetical protein [Lysobacter gummosus]|uniref:hypothetical protein n=1 Tax=Lysobacter gummosus TaxID=262324 RepID=UPI003642C0C3